MRDWLDTRLQEQYRLIKVLKNNDKSRIYQLRHKTLNQDIIKRVYKGNDSVYRLLMGISHPNIPRVYEVCEENDTVTVLEEYIDGITVGEILESGLYKEKGVRVIIDSLCKALSAVHAMGIIHRDIKPENVMIDNQGMVKLIDFDVSKTHKNHQEQDTHILGTTGYAAPEQFGFTQSDERTDIYSLGILMNVMLTGEHPSKRLYSGKLTKIIEKCTHIDPNKRYLNIQALAREL